MFITLYLILFVFCFVPTFLRYIYQNILGSLSLCFSLSLLSLRSLPYSCKGLHSIITKCVTHEMRSNCVKFFVWSTLSEWRFAFKSLTISQKILRLMGKSIETSLCCSAQFRFILATAFSKCSVFYSVFMLKQLTLFSTANVTARAVIVWLFNSV